MGDAEQNGLWQALLGEIELTVSRGSFVTWFKNTRLIEQSDEKLIVGVPNIFVKSQLEHKFNQLIAEVLQKNGVGTKTIEYRIQSASPSSRQRDNKNTPQLVSVSPRNDTPAHMKQSPLGNVSHGYRQGLNERYIFETFVVGSSNELAYAACQAIAASPGTKYNPLFIYGGVGIGKTHLIQAVGNQVITDNSKARVVYASTEQFVQEFVDALRFKKTTDFAKHYRSADVLIVDDMQFIAGKEKIQEEFFHTFNALHQANKQIIISSDKPPKEIPTLEDRLRSRFAWGMTIDMQTPDFETRCAILQSKASTHDISLPNDVVEFLAEHVPNNIRELEGALNQVLAFCEMRKVEPELAVVRAIFGNVRARPKHITARQVVERTAKIFQVGVEEMLGPKRDKEIVLPRQVAMYMLRSELHLSFPKIAHELGRKDHTTAIHSVEKIQREAALSSHLQQQINTIRERMYG